MDADEAAFRNAPVSLDGVYQLVRDRILRGELEPGLRISQVKLAEALEVSRTPLREALRLLEREGLVSAERNRMVRVADLSLDDLDDLYALRVTTEAAATQQTVPLLRADDLAELDSMLARMNESAEQRDVHGWSAPHRAFHRKLYSGAGPRALRLIEELGDHADRYIRFYGAHEPQAWNSGKGEHERIVEACRDGDGALAAARLARHLAHTVLAIFAQVAPEHQPTLLHQATRTVTTARTDTGKPGRRSA